MSRLADLGKEYYEVDKQIGELNEQVDNLKAKREELLNRLVAEMREEDLPEFSVEGINKRFALKTDQYASYLVENQEKVFEALRDLGYDGIMVDPNEATGEAYRYFQKYVLALKERGVILAVCSKNEESIAREPFEKNKYMILGMEDIACFVARQIILSIAIPFSFKILRTAS